MIRTSARVLLLLLGFGLCLQAALPPSHDLADRLGPVMAGKTAQDFKLGLALGAGAAKGLAHIGVLQALEEAGLRVDMVAGSSMGSVIGAGIACGLNSAELAEIAIGKDARDVIRLLDPVLFSEGFIDGERIRKFLMTIYGDRQIEDLDIPYMATTVDLRSGQLYYIDHGEVANAVRASISVPVVFTPVHMDSLVLIDGGFAEPVPVEAVRELGAEIIIAVNVLVPPTGPVNMEQIPRLNADGIHQDSSRTFGQKGYRRWSRDSWRMARILQSTYYITTGQVASSRMRLGNPDVIIEIDTGSSAWSFLDAEKIIQAGYQQTKAILSALEQAGSP